MAAVVAAPHRRASGAGRGGGVPRADAARRPDYFTAQLLDLDRMRGPVRRPTSSAGWATTTSSTRPTSRTPTPSTRTPPSTSSPCCPTSITDDVQAQDPLGQRRRPLPLPGRLDADVIRRGHRHRARLNRSDAPSGGTRCRREYADRGRPSTTTRSSRAYPPPPEYFETACFDDPDDIERVQLERLQERAVAAYRVPFFRRRWDAAGFHPSAITALARPGQGAPPTPSTTSGRASTPTRRGATTRASRPPTRCASRMRVYMSGGTTGQSRARPSTPQWDREVGAVLCSPAQLYLQGIRPGDVVLNSWAYGTHNGAFVFDEALLPLAQLRGPHHLDRQRHLQRAPGGAGHRLRRRRRPDHRRLPPAPGRRGPRTRVRPDART